MNVKRAALGAIVLVAMGIVSSCLSDIVSPQAQLKIDTVAIQNFFLANQIEPVRIQSGLWYAVDTLTDALYPTLTDSVRIRYITKVIPSQGDLSAASLSKVDESPGKTVLLSSVIAGWQQALLRITVGSSGRIYVASGLAYGAVDYKPTLASSSVIPANSNLWFEFKLLGSTSGTRLTSDLTAIDSYVSSISVVATKHASGIRYTSDNAGTGQSPTSVSTIDVTYTGKILKSDSLFANVTTPVTINLKDQVPAWRIILPQLKTGSTVTMYVPSGYGYGGTSPSVKIPANSNLVYTVTLLKVY
ncbi:hypothetical protein WSM22_29520 [Cytophagales bacterium WSM2-2]|nr:hypothetical protein WSM22_29520 [Cytophagales bacterium WSM2-2]